MFYIVELTHFSRINSCRVKVVLSLKSTNDEKILPLITLDGYSAGIILDKYPNNKVAYLNNDTNVIMRYL